MRHAIRSIALTAALTLGTFAPAAAEFADTSSRVAEQVRKEIVTLPFYSIFDHIQFRLEGDTVTLAGQVNRPTLKKGAERVALRVEGVNNVVNNIEVLPLSNFDDRIRVQMAYRMFNNSVLNRYGFRSVPPIHIIVRNGDVTLEGVVNREMEKNVAGIIANGVSGVFSVENNLRVEKL